MKKANPKSPILGLPGKPKPVPTPVDKTTQQINSKSFYHGTGMPNILPRTLDSSVTSPDGLFGPGIYLTDNPHVARGYSLTAMKNEKLGASFPTVYHAKPNFKKVLDLEKPATKAIKNTFLNTPPRGSSLDEWHGHIRELLNDPKTTTEDLYDKLSEAERYYEKPGARNYYGDEDGDDYSERKTHEQDYDEPHAAIRLNHKMMRDHGYDAFTHTGGRRMGGISHQVAIALDPTNAYGLGRRRNPIGNFSPISITEGAHSSINDAPPKRIPNGPRFDNIRDFDYKNANARPGALSLIPQHGDASPVPGARENIREQAHKSMIDAAAKSHDEPNHHLLNYMTDDEYMNNNFEPAKERYKEHQQDRDTALMEKLFGIHAMATNARTGDKSGDDLRKLMGLHRVHDWLEEHREGMHPKDDSAWHEKLSDLAPSWARPDQYERKDPENYARRLERDINNKQFYHDI